LLAQGQGNYRCGKCKKINNAIESLFDEWPDPGDQPSGAGELPVLGLSLDFEAAKKARLIPGESSFLRDDEGGEDSNTRFSEKHLRTAWISTAAVLLIVVAAYLAEFFHLRVMNSSGVEYRMDWTAQEETSPAVLPSDLNQIEILNRDMRSHPTLPDSLSLSLTIVNRATQLQAFPELEVTLFDSSGQALVNRRFQASEYLAPGADIDTGMTPEAYLHIKLALPDPGRKAVGFELDFR
jgi:hypothetical protein